MYAGGGGVVIFVVFVRVSVLCFRREVWVLTLQVFVPVGFGGLVVA